MRRIATFTHTKVGEVNRGKMPVVSPWTRCLSPVHLSNAAQVAVLTFNPHWWSLQNHSRLQMPNPLSGDNKMLSYFIGICQHVTKRDLYVSTEFHGKKEIMWEWVWMCWLSLSLLFIRGRSLWRKVIEDHSSQVYRWPPPAICTLSFSIHFRLFVSKWSCFQLSHWMVEFFIKTLFSVLLRNQVLNCKWLILICMRRCKTSTSAWKGNENVPWLWGKCILMCENEWRAFQLRNCFIQVNWKEEVYKESKWNTV